MDRTGLRRTLPTLLVTHVLAPGWQRFPRSGRVPSGVLRVAAGVHVSKGPNTAVSTSVFKTRNISIVFVPTATAGRGSPWESGL